MNGEELYPASTRSLDSLREMRLMALLRDLVEEQGRVKAAETLGVNYRTLVRAEESGQLTPRLAGALESHLLDGGGSAAATQRHRVAELERALRDGLAKVGNENTALRGEQAEAWDQVERRLAALEAAGNGTAGAKPDAASGTPAGGAAKTKPVTRRPYRDYPELVTRDPEPGEELVYGEAATAVIVRWREAWDAAANATDPLAKLDARQRQLGLEIELVEEHELTLPPATYPWDWADRRDEVRRRSLSLEDVRADRRRALLARRLRRVLTLGLCRR